MPYIESWNIQTRMFFAGNLDTTDRIMNDTFRLGVYPGMTDAMIDKMISVIKEKIQ